MGLEPLSEAPLCALQPLAPSFLVVLAEAACLRRLLDLSIVLPWPSVCFQDHLLCTYSCQQVFFSAWGILLLVRLRPLPDNSLGALGLLACFLWPSLRQRVCVTSGLSAWSDTYLAFVPQLEALSESLTHSIPRSFLVVSLSAYAVGFADALWLCPECALRLFFASVSFTLPPPPPTWTVRCFSVMSVSFFDGLGFV